jgi:hypothetical protein
MKTKADLMNPFPGLRSFRSDEDYLFFGREEQTLELVTRLQRNRFIAVVGTSGRGKSSLVRCGLLSRLQGGGMVEAGAHWEIAVMHPGGDPLRHLAAALLDAHLYDREAEDALPHLLATLGRSQFGLIEAVRQAKLPAKTNFLLVVDQFEEIFRYDEAGAAESERANDFIAMLREASAQAEVPIYIVTTMRSDFIGDCSRFEGLAEAVNRGEYLIPGLTRDQFKAAIEGPIRVACGQLAPRLLQRLLNDLGEEQDQLPCLQHALMRTWRVWQGRADAPALDLEDYAQVGKMSQALSLHADEVFSGLATDRQRELCAAMFKALTVEGSEKRGIRRPRRLQTLCGTLGVEAAELTPIIDAFRHPEVSFLMPPSDVPLRDTTVIDLSHESLMRVWTRLRDWVDDEAKSVGIFRRLSESAALWRQGKSGFYRDPELSIARAWVDASRPNAVWAEQYDGNFEQAMAFLQASSDAAQEDIRAQEAARQHELAQARALAEAERQRAEEQTRFAGRLRWLVRGLGLIAMVAVTATFIAFSARRTAQENAALARQSEAKAEAAGAMVDKARGEAEKLLSFLLEDFYDELAPTGRLDTVVKLADQAIAYYDQLPPELRSDNTTRNRSLAMIRRVSAARRRGLYDGGEAVAQAVREFQRLRTAGDRSETTTVGLATALLMQRTPPGEDYAEFQGAALKQADELLRELTSAPGSSRRSKLEYCRLRIMRGGSTTTSAVEGREIMEEVRAMLGGLGATDYTDLWAASLYAQATTTLGRHFGAAVNERLQQEAQSVAEQILRRQPGNLQALRIRSAALPAMIELAGDRLSPEELLERWQKVAHAREEWTRFDPLDAEPNYLTAIARQKQARVLIGLGRLDEAVALLRSVVATGRERSSFWMQAEAWVTIEEVEAKRGNEAGVAAAKNERRLLSNSAIDLRQLGNLSVVLKDKAAGLLSDGSLRATRMMQGKYDEVIADANEMLVRLDELSARPEIVPADKVFLEGVRERGWRHIGEANIMKGNYAEADRALRGRAANRAGAEKAEAPNSDMALRSVWHAMALAKLGRGAEALQILDLAVKFRRDSFARLPSSPNAREHLARVLYVQAIAQPDDDAGRANRMAALQEAKKLIDGIPPDSRDAYVIRTTSKWIDEELAKPGRK